MTYDGKTGGALAYVPPGQFPEFEGEDAWFEVRWFNKHRRELIRQVERKSVVGISTPAERLDRLASHLASNVGDQSDDQNAGGHHDRQRQADRHIAEHFNEHFDHRSIMRSTVV